MNIKTEKTRRIFTALKSTNCCVASRWLSQLMQLEGHRHAGVSQPRPRKAIKRRNFFSHLVKEALDADVTILAGNIENQLVQELPFRTCVPARLDCFHKLLH